MPIYEYQCGECKQIFEEWQKDFKERKHSCPVCGAEAERLISNTSFILKGSGWYVTDYKSASAGTGGNGNGKSDGSGKSEGKSSGSSEKPAGSESSPSTSSDASAPASSSGESAS
ncbi:MAG: FmdB family zinc ribbon protein [Desulfovibrionaceae bacterium]